MNRVWECDSSEAGWGGLGQYSINVTLLLSVTFGLPQYQTYTAKDWWNTNKMTFILSEYPVRIHICGGYRSV